MSIRISSTFATSLLAVAAALSLVACEREDDRRSAGQQVDAAVAKVEQKAGEAKQDVREAGKDLAQAAGGLADKARDLAITTAVNGKLARDPGLSALRIDVDTVNGHVALHGSAPDMPARARATALATSVDGVVSVDNQLTVAAHS